MNDNKSLKLHKSHKIVCFIVCFVIATSFLVIPSFAEDNTIKAGTYTFNDVISYQSLDLVKLPFTVTVYNPQTQLDELMTFDTLDFADVSTTGTPYYRLDYLYYDGTTLQNMLQVYSDAHHWNEMYHFYKSIAEESGEPLPSWLDSIKGIGKTITVTEDTPVSATFYEWFTTNTTPPTPPTPPYDGNPLVDILNAVMDALDVNIFGYFSYLDIASTLIGACLCIWLLKMLAGG